MPKGYTQSFLDAIACPADGSCTAVGGAATRTGGGPVAWDENDGIWRAAVLPVPPGVTAAQAGLANLACQSAGNCVAVGGEDGDLLAVEANGVWSTLAAPLPAALPAGSPWDFTAAACPRTGNCSLLGEYDANSTDNGGFVDSGSGKSWTSTVLPAPAGKGAGYGFIYLTSAACPPAGNCTAVGYADLYKSRGVLRPLVATGSGSAWKLRLVSPPSGWPAGYASLTAVTCSGPADCTATGNGLPALRSGEPQSPFVDAETAGTWAAVPLPVAGNSFGWSNVDSVSCPEAGGCVAGGSYSPAENKNAPLIDDQNGAGWSKAIASLPGDAGPYQSDLDVDVSVACVPGSTSCFGADEYRSAAGGTELALFSRSDGIWMSSPAPVPASWHGTTVSFAGLACGSLGTCAAGGTGDNGTVAFVADNCDADPDVTDGDWQIGGCFSRPNATTYTDTSRSTADGLLVQSVGSDTVRYSDGGAGGYQATSTGPVTMSASIGGSPEQFYRGVLSLALKRKSTSITVSKGTTLAGIAVTGKLTLDPVGKGTVTGALTAQLPGPLGGGTATMLFKSQQGKGVTSLDITAGHASLAKLFSLENLRLTYDDGTWVVKATATTPAGGSADFTGTLTVVKDKIAGASLGFKGLSIAGLADLKSFSVGFAKGTWTGAAELAQGDQAATLTLEFKGGTLTHALFATKGEFSLFGVLPLKKFELEYQAAADEWRLAVEPALKGGEDVGVELKVSGGAVVGGTLKFGKIGFADLLTIDDATLAYSAPSTYEGSAKVTLPGPAGAVIKAAFKFSNGSFVSGSIKIEGLHVPIGWGVILTGGGISVTASPLELAGEIDLAAGPDLPKLGAPILGLDGSLTYRSAAGAKPASYSLAGTLKVASLTLGTGVLTLEGPAAAILITLGKDGKGYTFGSVAKLTGTLDGAFSATGFYVEGQMEFTVKGLGTLKAEGAAGLDGMAACKKTSSGSEGFEWLWSHPRPTIKKDDCSIKVAGPKI